MQLRQPLLPALRVLLILLPFTPSITAFNTSLCVANCVNFDTTYFTCNYEYGPSSPTDTSNYPKFLKSCCAGYDPAEILGYLSRCTVCDQDGLGQQSLAFYQTWDVVCGVYAGAGFASGLSVLSSWSLPEVTQFFSASVLPDLQAGDQITGFTVGAAVATTTGDESTTPAAGAASTSVTNVLSSSSVVVGTSMILSSSAPAAAASTASASTASATTATSSTTAIATSASATTAPTVSPTTTAPAQSSASAASAAASSSSTSGSAATRLRDSSVFSYLLSALVLLGFM